MSIWKVNGCTLDPIAHDTRSRSVTLATGLGKIGVDQAIRPRPTHRWPAGFAGLAQLAESAESSSAVEI